MVIVLLALLLASCRRGPVPVEVVVDSAVRYQTFEGFGASINAWSPELSGYYDRPEFRRLYLDELGASVLRVELHGDVVPERARWQDMTHREFVLDGPGERGATYLRVAEALTRDTGGTLRVIASVWSPPAWMKVNGTTGNGHPDRKNYALSAADLGLEVEDGRPPPSQQERERYLLGNKLRRDRYDHFAKSLVEWTRLYRARGVELFGLSPQNEPRFSHWFGSTVYSPAELADVVGTIVRMFELEGEPLPRLFVPETMSHDVAGNDAYLRALFAAEGVGKAVYALAAHGYVDGYLSDDKPESPRRFFELARRYGKPVWLTEGGTGDHGWPGALRGFGMSLLNSLGEGHASLITPWQAVTRGPSTHGLALVDGPTRKTAVAKTFFRTVRPQMQRVRTTSSKKELKSLGMLEVPEAGDAARFVVLILINESEQARTVRLRGANSELEVVSARITDGARSDEPLPFERKGSLNVPALSVVSIRSRVIDHN